MYTIEVGGEVLNVSKIAAGANHTCAVTTAGRLKCWGYNGYGQLGDGSLTNRVTAVDVVGLGSGVASISTGHYYTCATLTSGAAKCWGYNGAGQLGDNSATSRSAPVTVVGLTSGVASITAGNGHTCATLTSGAAKCWGTNGNGQLGVNDTNSRSTPVDVLGSGVAEISAGGNHSCALMTSGTAKCWGGNSFGQLGDNSTATRLTPVDVQASQ